MDNKSTTKRMIGAVVLVLIAALLLAWLLKGKNKSVEEQQLIAEQTQDASPILGFPGVQEGADGQQQLADGSTGQDDAPYVIGSAEQAADGTQGAMDNAQQQLSDAGKAAGDAADSLAGKVNGAVDAGKEAANNLASQMEQNDTTGFQVRDGGSEQRPIVEDGEVKPGVGSMGGNEVATGDGAADATQQQQTAGTDGGDTQQVAGSGSSASQSSGSTAQQSASADKADSEEKQRVANPRLVNETPVPAPRSQTASRSTGSSAAGDNTTASSRSTTEAASTAPAASSGGGSGYAIQVVAASSQKMAEQVRQSIAVDGYPTFVVRANVNGKTVYRVRVGTYPERGAAQAVQNRMKARYSQNQYVQNSFVTRN
ncbi:MAG: SPOR domain-containing protein [Thiolinea sp.]